jgi:predicted HD superfamily hydrolase involved in NAD metabolism
VRPLSIEQCQNFVLEKLGDTYRYHHSLKVAETALKLASYYPQINPLDIEYTGLFHDVAKSFSPQQAKSYFTSHHTPFCEELLSFPSIIHGFVAALMIDKELGITQPTVLDAITYHTTGKKDFSDLGLILYITDFIASQKDEDLAKQLFDEATHNLYSSALKICSHTFHYLITQQVAIHPNSLYMYNWLLPLKS